MKLFSPNLACPHIPQGALIIRLQTTTISIWFTLGSIGYQGTDGCHYIESTAHEWLGLPTYLTFPGQDISPPLCACCWPQTVPLGHDDMPLTFMTALLLLTPYRDPTHIAWTWPDSVHSWVTHHGCHKNRLCFLSVINWASLWYSLIPSLGTRLPSGSESRSMQMWPNTNQMSTTIKAGALL